MRVLNKKHWPYPVRCDAVELINGEALAWCQEMFPGKDRWCYAMSGHIHFKNEDDAAFFTLKWS